MACAVSVKLVATSMWSGSIRVDFCIMLFASLKLVLEQVDQLHWYRPEKRNSIVF